MKTVPLGRMACTDCEGTYAPGFLRCPHCKARSPLFPEWIATTGRTPSVVDGSVRVVEDDGEVSVGFGWEPCDPAPSPDAGAAAGEEPAPVRRPRGRPRKAVTQDDPADAGS